MMARDKPAKIPLGKSDKGEPMEMERPGTDKPAMARMLIEPNLRHACALANLTNPVLGNADDIPRPDLADYVVALQAHEKKAVDGNLAASSRMLMSQAVTLDALFTEALRRMTCNMGEHLGAMEIYARIALKAQAQSRATLEALAKLYQPREQTVRHVHVNEGGQAIVADQFHHHTGGMQNGKSDKQSHATGGAGTSPALPCQDTDGIGMPIASGEGPEAMPSPRRHKSRRTQGQ